VFRYLGAEWIAPLLVALLLAGGTLGPSISTGVATFVDRLGFVIYPLTVAAIIFTGIDVARRAFRRSDWPDRP
ncbi:MAG: hypothetical protein WAP37_02020, partial [Solirubrobacterales bacterium]